MTNIEVMARVERRRRFTEEEKDRLVQESLRPGMSVAAVARQNEISQSLLFSWRRERRLKSSSDSTIDRRPANTPAALPGFVRVEAAEPSTDENFIRVHLDEEMVIEFPLATDPRRLVAIVHAIKRK